ncbi:MAG: hypothetical protein SFY66_21710 [Oculatellaceae cyanobacterium bins.114]|nr:hypothetical protein [Oculatellaceae cyanobacterium bins.114]
MGTFQQHSTVFTVRERSPVEICSLRLGIFTIYSMIMQEVKKLFPPLLSVLCLYFLSYACARVAVFQTVEHYSGADGKSGLRQDYIAKRDRPAGEGWEYHMFLPIIKAEEGIINYFHHR